MMEYWFVIDDHWQRIHLFTLHSSSLYTRLAHVFEMMEQENKSI